MWGDLAPGNVVSGIIEGFGAIYGGQQAKKQQRRMAQSERRMGRELEQQYGWGGTRPQAMYLNPPSLPVPYGGSGSRLPTDSGFGWGDLVRQLPNVLGQARAAADEYGRARYGDAYDPTPGPWAADDPRSQDTMVTYDRRGRPRRPPTHPARTALVGRDGRSYEYRSIGRALLSTLDMSGYRKVCRVAHELLGGPKPKMSSRRRCKTRKRKSKRCGPTNLSPAQLAAGFGGKRYRR